MIKLSDIPTTLSDDLDRDEAEKKTKEWAKEIGRMQHMMRAQSKYSVLVVLQGMDASGKDGAVKNVFEYCHHSGVRVVPFKKPSELEMSHDFLWRVHQQAPAAGMFHIFNRSHYEDILIQRVHGWIDDERAAKRMAAINAFEDLLWFDNNTLVLKFYLHISFDQQKEELQQRIDEEDKHWKHNENDWKERKHWDEYMRCYEYAINESKTPWHIIPVDKRWQRDYRMTRIIRDEMRKLDLFFPELPK